MLQTHCYNVLWIWIHIKIRRGASPSSKAFQAIIAIPLFNNLDADHHIGCPWSSQYMLCSKPRCSVALAAEAIKFLPRRYLQFLNLSLATSQFTGAVAKLIFEPTKFHSHTLQFWIRFSLTLISTLPNISLTHTTYLLLCQMLFLLLQDHHKYLIFLKYLRMGTNMNSYVLMYSRDQGLKLSTFS